MNAWIRIQAALLTAATLLLGGGCGQKTENAGEAATNSTSGSSPLTAPADYLGAITKGQQTAVKTVDTASLEKAIQLFGVEHGRNPKDLNELVKEKFIPQLPAAPYGMKIEYDATTGTVKVVPQ